MIWETWSSWYKWVRNDQDKMRQDLLGSMAGVPAFFEVSLCLPIFIHEQLFIHVCVLVAQSCPTLSNALDCSLPGSSLHGIFQATGYEWVAFPFSKGSSQPRDLTQVSYIIGKSFTIWPPANPLCVDIQGNFPWKKRNVYVIWVLSYLHHSNIPLRFLCQKRAWQLPSMAQW